MLNTDLAIVSLDTIRDAAARIAAGKFDPTVALGELSWSSLRNRLGGSIMHRSFCILTLIVLFVPAILAQPEGSKLQETAPACPSAATLDDLTKALDDAVSGPQNKDRTCLRQVLLPQARLTPISKTPEGNFAPRILTVDDWIGAVAKRGSALMYEVQVKVNSETYGHFAHLWSTYEIRPTPAGKATVVGINSVQAVFDGTRWRVLSVLWEPDTTAGPVPEKYLP
jgi:hypothetical protein